MVKMYTIIQNGIEENKYGGILTILSHLEKQYYKKLDEEKEAYYKK